MQALDCVKCALLRGVTPVTLAYMYKANSALVVLLAGTCLAILSLSQSVPVILLSWVCNALSCKQQVERDTQYLNVFYLMVVHRRPYRTWYFSDPFPCYFVVYLKVKDLKDLVRYI